MAARSRISTVSWFRRARFVLLLARHRSREQNVETNKRLTSVSVDIFPGFAADIPKNNVPKIEALSTEYPALVESDGIVTTQGDKKDESGIHF